MTAHLLGPINVVSTTLETWFSINIVLAKYFRTLVF